MTLAKQKINFDENIISAIDTECKRENVANYTQTQLKGGIRTFISYKKKWDPYKTAKL